MVRPVVVGAVYKLYVIIVETEGTEDRKVEAEDITQHGQQAGKLPETYTGYNSTRTAGWETP